jgi:hypothetical protein
VTRNFMAISLGWGRVMPTLLLPPGERKGG